MEWVSQMFCTGNMHCISIENHIFNEQRWLPSWNCHFIWLYFALLHNIFVVYFLFNTKLFMMLNSPTIPQVMPLTEAVLVSEYSSVIAKVTVWICMCRLRQGHRIRFPFCICTRPWFFTDNYSSLFFTELLNYTLILILCTHSIDPHKVTNKTIWI